MGESNMSVEQQPNPNVLEQSPSREAGLSTRLAEVRLSARTIVPRVTLSLIDEKLDKLSTRPGFLKFSTNAERQQLENQKASIQASLQGQTEAQGEIKFPDRKQQELFHVRLGQEIKTVAGKYENLLQEILQDETLTTEIKDGYINTVISPFVVKSTQNNEEEMTFYSAFSNFVNHREDPIAQRETHKKRLFNSFPNSWENNYPIRVQLRSLEGFEDNKFIKSMLAKIAAKDVVTLTGDNIPWKVYETALKPTSKDTSDENYFEHLLLQKLYDQVHGNPHYNIVPDAIFFQAVKSSKRANEILGEEIESQDQEYYTKALNDSLSDFGNDSSHLLYYYPTPDTIRNLIILSTSYYHDTGLAASCTLKKFTERADWKEILAKAEEVYPSLKTVGPLLSNPKNFGSSNGYRGKIDEEIQDLLLTNIENSASDPKLKEFSISSLNTHSILGILIKRGIIEPSEVTMINKILEQPHADNFHPYYLKDTLRSLMTEDKTTDWAKELVDTVRRVEILSRILLENKSNPQAEVYLQKHEVINKLRDPSLKQEDVTIFLEAFKTIPALTSKNERDDPNELQHYSINSYLLEEFIKQFRGKDTIQLFSDLNASYSSFPNHLSQIVRLVGESVITKERAVELPTKASDIITNPLFSLAMEFPRTFLPTDQDTQFFRNMLVSYQNDAESIRLIATKLENNLITRDFVLAFPQQAPALMQDKMKETRIFVLNHGNTLLKDSTDLKFLNRMVGEFGQKSDSLIRGYQECLEAGAVTIEEKELVLEFAKQFRVVAPTTLAGYKEAKQGGFEKGYIAQLKALAEKMTGSGTITDEERKKPYYKDLLRHVYSNNAGQYGSFESNESCAERSSDLTGFKINPRYEIDLLSQSEIRIKTGETPNPSVQDEVQKPIISVAERMNALGHDKEKIQLMLKEEIDKTFKEIVENSGLQGIDINSVMSNEEKMFLILTDSIYGTGSIDPKRVKDLVTTYEFATFEDISDYMAGTRDRVSRANNQDYALLCEVGAFYSDRIKEVNRRLVEEAYKNPQIEALMPEYFRKLSQESVVTQKQDKINRLQVERLGASESFVKQLTRVLEKRRGRKYEPEEVKEIIRRYEGVTGGLQEKSSNSQNPQTRAFYGQLRSQRERSFEALRIITGENVDPKKIHLGEINLKEALDTETGIKEGKYESEQFASYTAQRFIDLFEDERIKIEGELAKFESITGKQREVLYGYISKSKESANARMVGGVCVAGDNPSKNKDQNMWDMPNYFQLVFQEPDTLQCQGAVLLHNFTQDGKRILAASLNPSSTYLYSVDETALFNGIMGTLEQFARDNNIDMITFSQNRTIRTNRTGGQFEKTMDARIASVNKKFAFSSPQTFSYSPKYQLQEMDVAWERI